MGAKPIGVFITDTHLDDENFELVESAHQQAIDLAISLGLKEVFHLGDHFECRTSQSLKVLLDMNKIISMYEKSEIVLLTISGNHDKTDQSSSESYIDIYKSEYFLNMDGKILYKNKVQFHFLSYYEEGFYQKNLAELQVNSEEDTPAVLLTHYGIDGVLNNDSTEVNSNVKANDFKYYKKVLIGHYHNASNPKKSIHYIGSTDPRNFGEDDEKGATILYDDFSRKLLQFEFKSYKKIVIEDFSFNDVSDIIKKYKDENQHVKIEFIGKRDQLIKVDKKKLIEAGIQVTTVDTTLINIEGKVNPGEVTIGMERKHILKHFDQYSRENNIPRKKVANVIKRF